MNQRKYIWPCFLALLILTIYAKFSSIDFDLKDDFVIGHATLYGVSVRERISYYYLAIILFVFTYLIFFWGVRKLNPRIERNTQASQVDSLILVGSLLALLSLFNEMLLESALFVAFFSALMLLMGGLEQTKKACFTNDTWLVIGMSFLSGYLLFHSAVIGGIFSLILCFCVSKWGIESVFTKVTTSFFIACPLIAFITVESTLILNQRGIYLHSYLFLFVVSLLLSFVVFYWIARKKNWKEQAFIYRFLAPLCIIGCVLAHHYTPIIKQPDDLFETANMLNPIMQWVQFGETPISDNLCSHLISDFFWSGIYTLFNGYKAESSILIYAEFSVIFYLLITYYFLRSVVGNKPWVLVALFLIPATLYFLPNYYSVVLLPYAFLYRYFKNNNRKYFYRFVLSIILICLWRLDLGISLISSLILFIPIWLFARKEDLKIILKWTSIAVVLGLIIGISFLLFHPRELKQMLEYFGANQAHALGNLTDIKNNIFYVNFLILPLTVASIVLHSLMKLQKSEYKAELLLLIILSFFYFFNLQRGLVRHSFAEQNDIQIASFGWAVIAIKVWIWIKIVSLKKEHLSFVVLALSLIPLFFSYNALKGTENLFQKEQRFGLSNLPQLNGTRITRYQTNPAVEQKAAELVTFLKTYLKADETFLDFTLNPSLYFYAEKNVPSYFNQYLQNTITDNLQYQNLIDLKKHNVPIVLFSHAAEHSLDNLDNIPNRVRHHILTKYIYDNYEPYTQIGSFRVWKRKDWKCSYKSSTPYPELSEIWHLGQLSYFWKQTKQSQFAASSTSKIMYDEQSRSFDLKKRLEPNEFLQLELSTEDDQAFFLGTDHFRVDFQVIKGTQIYHIPLGCSENLRADSLRIHTYSPTSPVVVKSYELVRLIER